MKPPITTPTFHQNVRRGLNLTAGELYHLPGISQVHYLDSQYVTPPDGVADGSAASPWTDIETALIEVESTEPQGSALILMPGLHGAESPGEITWPNNCSLINPNGRGQVIFNRNVLTSNSTATIEKITNTSLISNFAFGTDEWNNLAYVDCNFDATIQTLGGVTGFDVWNHVNCIFTRDDAPSWVSYSIAGGSHFFTNCLFNFFARPTFGRSDALPIDALFTNLKFTNCLILSEFFTLRSETGKTTTVTFFNCEFQNPLIFDNVGEGDIHVEMDLLSYHEIIAAGTDFDVPNVTIEITGDIPFNHTVYVSHQAPDGGTGTIIRPFNTITDALDAIDDEDGANPYVIKLAAGRYENVDGITLRPWISLKGESVGALTTINGNVDVSGSDGLIVIDGVHIAGVMDFIMDAGLTTGAVIHINCLLGDGTGRNDYGGMGAGNTNFTFTNCVMLNEFEIRHATVSIDGSTMTQRTRFLVNELLLPPGATPDADGYMTTVNINASHVIQGTAGFGMGLISEHPTEQGRLKMIGVDNAYQFRVESIGGGPLMLEHDGVSLGDDTVFAGTAAITVRQISGNSFNSSAASDVPIPGAGVDVEIVRMDATGLVPGTYKIEVSMVWHVIDGAGQPESLQWEVAGDFPSPMLTEESADSTDVKTWSYAFPVEVTGTTAEIILQAQTEDTEDATVLSANIMLERKG